jgi:subtilisin family serine protease
MKKSMLLLLFTNILLAQTPNKAMQDKMNFKSGELIVKLKDNVDAKVYYSKSGKAMSDFNIASFLGIDDKVESSKVLFHQKSIEASIVNQKKMKAVYAAKKSQNPSNGYQPEEPLTLKNIFVLKTKQQEENILGLIEQLKGDKNVEYAEPNYRFSINDFEVASDIIYDKDLTPTKNTSTTVPNDPLYSQQTNITQTNIDDVWNEYTTGDGSQIVAILDTGVDYTHPDLAANIWINEAELNGVEGFDDDGNGYVDDIRGWDFHHNTNTPLDDNMHGTHVAGIVGAVGGNGIGVAGAAWNVKLMPIKVFQASGIGDLSTIATGIDYAVNNGATVLNMSFGGGFTSITMYNALANAYAGSQRFLVGAAGNNGLPLPPCIPSQIFYPAAYTFVFGVEAEGSFSNYDCDGPIFSTLLDQQNYETKAPGVSILSTVPNGGYRKLSGTSMSAPLVSGIIALYNQIRENETNERKFGNLINTKTGTFIDALAAIKAEPKPILKLLTAEAIDSISTNTYQDGQLDAGEEIHLYPTVKNYWGRAENVKVELKFAGNEFSNDYYKSLVEIQDSIITLGTISDYGIYKQRENPLKFKITKEIAHNTQIEFRMVAWEDNDPNSNDRYPSTSRIDSLDFKLKVKNGVKLQGLIEKDTVLTADHEYIITNPLIVEAANLIIKPGVTIRFGEDELTQQRGKILLYQKNGINAQIIAQGTKDSLITFKPDTYNNNYVELSFDNNGRNGTNQPQTICDWCVFERMHVVYPPSIKNSQFFDAGAYGGTIETSNFVQSDGYLYSISGWKNSNLVDFNSGDWQKIYYSPAELNILGWYRTEHNYIGNYSTIKLEGFSANSNQEFEKFYMGTGSVDILKEINYDAFDGNNAGFFRYNNPRLTPYEEAPAIVWKVEVNGKNAWDEYDGLDALGVGTHEFKIYYNRPVDKSIKPSIGYGVRDPWNTNLISETGSWNTEGTIYTVNHEIGILATDGINRINVWGAKDLNGWDIPVEKRRFNMLVQSAGSASTGFMATAGLGEITLNWTPPSESDLNDVLGYNMYRYTANEDGTFTDPVKVNQSLVTDVSFKDYDVVRNTQYFYKYKILRTSFEETDYSNAVSSQLLTAALGDSNGDSSVNVMDVVNTVDYILGNNPTPFVDYATDVNNDSAVNVLDVVGIVDMILNPTSGKVATKGANSVNYYSNVPVGDATFYWENDDLYVESEFNITGLQLAFHKNFTYSIANNLPKFEWLNYNQDSTKVTMMYSFGDLKIPAGKTKILTKTNPEEVTFNVDKAVVATTSGGKLNAVYESKSVLGIDAPDQGDVAKIFTIGPNPTSGILNVFYYLPELMDNVRMTAYDIQGKVVWWNDSFKNTSGQTSTSVDISSLNNGIYFLVIDVVRSNQIHKREVKRIIIQK